MTEFSFLSGVSLKPVKTRKPHKISLTSFVCFFQPGQNTQKCNQVIWQL